MVRLGFVAGRSSMVRLGFAPGQRSMVRLGFAPGQRLCSFCNMKCVSRLFDAAYFAENNMKGLKNGFYVAKILLRRPLTT